MTRTRALAISLIALFGVACQQVGSGEQGVLFERFGGGTQDEVYGEGVHIVPPWNYMFIYDVRTQDRPEKMQILTSNGLSVDMDVSIRYRPVQAALPELHQTVGPRYYETIVKPTLRSELRKIVGNYTPEEIYSTKRDEVSAVIDASIKKAVEDRNIEIEGIFIRNVILPEKLKQAISEKLEEEQRSEKMQFTLAREKQEADRKRIEAQGIADFQKIVSTGISDQLLQWKGIEATEQLAASPNSKVVVIGAGKSGLPLILGGSELTEAMRTILHADMDAFFAAIEQRDDPSLRGKPVLVGGSSPRGVVAAASYEAREFGIHSAMPSVEAKRRCPQAIFVRGRMSVYGRESRRIFEIFRRFSPLVEGLSLDEAFIDLTGTERLHGPPEKAARELRAAVRRETDLAVSVGIAPVKLVAKIASDMAKPDGMLRVAPSRVRAFLDPLPVGRIWGIGPVARSRLEQIGVKTIGDLALCRDASLEAALGSWGPQAARLARGEDAREVEPYREAKSYGEENTFSEDVADRARLEAAIRAHSEAVARRLRRDGVRGRGVTLKLKLARRLGGGRFPLLTRSSTLLQPSDDGTEIANAARQLLARAALLEPVRLLGVSVSRLEAAAAEQLGLFDPPGRGRTDRARLNAVVDQIHDRFGRNKLERGIDPVERAGLSLQIKRGEDPEP